MLFPKPLLQMMHKVFIDKIIKIFNQNKDLGPKVFIDYVGPMVLFRFLYFFGL